MHYLKRIYIRSVHPAVSPALLLIMAVFANGRPAAHHQYRRPCRKHLNQRAECSGDGHAQGSGAYCTYKHFVRLAAIMPKADPHRLPLLTPAPPPRNYLRFQTTLIQSRPGHRASNPYTLPCRTSGAVSNLPRPRRSCNRGRAPCGKGQ